MCSVHARIRHPRPALLTPKHIFCGYGSIKTPCLDWYIVPANPSIYERQENGLDRKFMPKMHKNSWQSASELQLVCVCVCGHVSPVIKLVTGPGWVTGSHSVTFGIDSSTSWPWSGINWKMKGKNRDWTDGWTVYKPKKAFIKDCYYSFLCILDFYF